MADDNEVLKTPVQNETNWIIRDAQNTEAKANQPDNQDYKEIQKKDFWAKVKYAFATEDESFDKFSEEEMLLLNKVADAVMKKRLSAPALMFLESVRPLNFLGSQTIVFFEPIVSFVISTKELALLGRILEKRKSIPLLIDLIEKKETDARQCLSAPRAQNVKTK